MLKPRSSEIHRWARKLIVTFPRFYSEKLFSGLLTYSRVLWVTLLTYSRESRIFVLTYSRVFTRKAASVLDPSFLEYNVIWIYINVWNTAARTFLKISQQLIDHAILTHHERSA